MSLFTKSYLKVLKLVYENPKVRFNELMREAKVSARVLNEIIDEFVNFGIVREDKIVEGKKVLMRSFYPNFETEEGKNIFSFVEIEKKREFFLRNKKLTESFRQLIDNVKGIEILLVFGSFANNSQTKESDLDILILTDDKIDRVKLSKEIERAFVTFENEVSPRIDIIEDFKKNMGSAIYQTIIKNHVVVKGTREFMRVLDLEVKWR